MSKDDTEDWEQNWKTPKMDELIERMNSNPVLDYNEDLSSGDPPSAQSDGASTSKSSGNAIRPSPGDATRPILATPLGHPETPLGPSADATWPSGSATLPIRAMTMHHPAMMTEDFHAWLIRAMTMHHPAMMTEDFHAWLIKLGLGIF
jgi:hypothetical protein